VPKDTFWSAFKTTFMKKNILTLFSFAILFTAVSCTTSSTDSASAVTNTELKESSTRSAPGVNQEEEEDYNLLLARKWQNESGAIYLNLKIDGSFEGRFDSDNIVLGNWTVSDDQKVLSLKENKASDGKGGNLNVAYTILDMSSNNMKVVDEDGTEFEFVGS
jgi:hypothetical protein